MVEIVLLSGKGGTGKTSLSAAFATLGGNHVIADCDVDAANLHLILQPDHYREEKFVTGQRAVIDPEKCSQCGLCIDFCRFEAIADRNGEVAVSETLCDGCKLCSRICPSGAIQMVDCDKSRYYSGAFRNGFMVHARLAPGEENSGKLVSVVREEARRLAEISGGRTIITDGPPGTGCPVISSLTGADKVILVTEPTRSGFHDLRRITELTAGFKIPVSVVVNKYDLNDDMTGQIQTWCLESGIPVIGKIPFEPAVVEAMLHFKSIVEWAPQSDAAKEIGAIFSACF